MSVREVSPTPSVSHAGHQPPQWPATRVRQHRRLSTLLLAVCDIESEPPLPRWIRQSGVGGEAAVSTIWLSSLSAEATGVVTMFTIGNSRSPTRSATRLARCELQLRSRAPLEVRRCFEIDFDVGMPSGSRRGAMLPSNTGSSRVDKPVRRPGRVGDLPEWGAASLCVLLPLSVVDSCWSKPVGALTVLRPFSGRVARWRRGLFWKRPDGAFRGNGPHGRLSTWGQSSQVDRLGRSGDLSGRRLF